MARTSDDHTPRSTARRRGLLPERTRLIARTRRITFAGLLVVVGLVLGLSWALARSFASGSTWWIDLIHVTAFATFALLAWLLAKRSTRLIEELFAQEDRLMLAVVHEVNRPLSRLVAATDDGLSGAVPAESALNQVSAQADALSELVSGLVEIARVATGAIPLPEEVVELGELAAGLERTDAAGSATLVVDARPVVVIGSPRLLRFAMANLVRNAAQHAYHGGPGTIAVRVDARGVTVTDDGPGIDEAQLAELRRRQSFLMLRQARVGMGVPLAAWVAETHGGTLGLANRPGGGFEARLELPVQPDDVTEEGGRL